jgi:hypothetical protein
VARFPGNIERSDNADGHGLAGLIVGTRRTDPNGSFGSLSTDRHRRVRSWLAGCAILLAVAPSALAETERSHADWTVLTVARSGAWGMSTARTQGKAIAGSLSQCQARSPEPSDCGAVQLHYKGGWALALVCGHHRVMVAARDRESAEAIAIERISALEQIHGTLPPCRRVLTIDPAGATTTTKMPAR